MRTKPDYNLLIKAEKIRFQSDFSSSHWLHQLLCKYEEQDMNKLRRDAFNKVLNCAINFGCKAAIKLSKEYPEAAGFPNFIKLKNNNWNKTCNSILSNFDEHISNRFCYMRNGD